MKNYPQLSSTRVRVGSTNTPQNDSRFSVLLALGAGLVLASMLKGTSR